MVYNRVLTAKKRGPQIAGAQIAGVYYTYITNTLYAGFVKVKGYYV